MFLGVPSFLLSRGLLLLRLIGLTFCSFNLTGASQGVYQHVSIEEDPMAKDDPLTLSRRLTINVGSDQEEVFEDLDEIIARYIAPMADLVRSLTDNKVFKNVTDKAALGEQLALEKQANPQRIPYCFAPVADAPGRFWLGFVPGRTPKFQVRVRDRTRQWRWEGESGKGGEEEGGK